MQTMDLLSMVTSDWGAVYTEKLGSISLAFEVFNL